METVDLPAVAADIAAEFDADPERILLDVEDLARVLASHGLLEGTDPDR